jgi:hypothetical protein
MISFPSSSYERPATPGYARSEASTSRHNKPEPRPGCNLAQLVPWPAWRHRPSRTWWLTERPQSSRHGQLSWSRLPKTPALSILRHSLTVTIRHSVPNPPTTSNGWRRKPASFSAQKARLTQISPIRFSPSSLKNFSLPSSLKIRPTPKMVCIACVGGAASQMQIKRKPNANQTQVKRKPFRNLHGHRDLGRTQAKRRPNANETQIKRKSICIPSLQVKTEGRPISPIRKQQE